jgi:arylsulfatase A-like enzyme
MIVRYSGNIAAGRVDDTPWAFWDVLPTLAELVGASPPSGIDGVSMLPTILGVSRAGSQPAHPPFYWEFHEHGLSQAVRFGSWKAVRSQKDAPLELYDLATDLGEQHNVAAQNPSVIAEAEMLLAHSRTKSDYLPIDRER